MLIALILILTWPSPCIQALYLIAMLRAAGEPSKAQSTKHKAEPSPAISHQPSAISHPCSTGIACRVYDPGVPMRVHSFYGLGIADSNLTAC